MKKLIKSCIYSCLIGYFIFGITLLIGILFAIQQNTFTLNSVFIYAEILVKVDRKPPDFNPGI